MLFRESNVPFSGFASEVFENEELNKEKFLFSLLEILATYLLLNKNIMNETIRSNKKYKNLLGHEKAEKIMLNYNEDSDIN